MGNVRIIPRTVLITVAIPLALLTLGLIGPGQPSAEADPSPGPKLTDNRDPATVPDATRTFHAVLIQTKYAVDRDVPPMYQALHDAWGDKEGNVWAITGFQSVEHLKELGLDESKISEGGEEDINGAIEDVKNTAQPGDEVIIFFVAHGSNRIEDENGDEKRDEALDAGDSWITDDELAVRLSGFKQGVTLTVILNGCYCGGFTDGDTDLQTITFRDEDGKDVPGDADHLAVLMGSESAMHPTHEGSEDNPSVFPAKIVEGLQRDGATTRADTDEKTGNNDGVTTAEEIFKYAAPRTKACLEETNQRQNPSMWPPHESSNGGDHDVVPDECPNVVENDSDGDGISDDVDACPTIYSPCGCAAVGGITELLVDGSAAASAAEASGSSAPPYAAIAGAAAAAAAVALSVGTWYARRRLS